VTVNNDAGPYGFCNWNEYNLNPLTRNDWRASLVPAAAVIPAPIAYIKVVAVKKLVVGCKTRPLVDRQVGLVCCVSMPGMTVREDGGNRVYCEEIRVFKAGISLNTPAWNNGIGRVVLFCWFEDDRNDEEGQLGALVFDSQR
jgi:hypothetical protein